VPRRLNVILAVAVALFMVFAASEVVMANGGMLLDSFNSSEGLPQLSGELTTDGDSLFLEVRADPMAVSGNNAYMAWLVYTGDADPSGFDGPWDDAYLLNDNWFSAGPQGKIQWGIGDGSTHPWSNQGALPDGVELAYKEDGEAGIWTMTISYEAIGAEQGDEISYMVQARYHDTDTGDKTLNQSHSGEGFNPLYFSENFQSVTLPPPPSEVWVDDDYDEGTTGWGYDHFASIQDAIDGVESGATIEVAAGTYVGNLEVDVPNLTLRSLVEHGAVIQTEAGFASGDGYGGITVLADGVTIDGFKIEQGVKQAVIHTHDSHDVTIKNNRIVGLGQARPRGIDVGFSTADSDNVNVEGNVFQELYCGLYVSRGANLMVDDNEFKDMVDGAIVFDDVAPYPENVEVKNNEATDANYLLYFFVVGGSVTGENNTLGNTELSNYGVYNTDQKRFFPTIQEAIDAASHGDTIKVAPGAYDENVFVTESLSLLGSGPDETVLSGGIELQANNVTVGGFKVEGGILSGSQNAGIYVVRGTSGHVVSHNELVGRGKDVTGWPGIMFGYDTSDISIENNSIHDWYQGMYINPSQAITIEGNTFDGNYVGIGSDGLDDISVIKNKFTNNEAEGWGSSNVGDNVAAHGNLFIDNGVAVAQYSGNKLVGHHRRRRDSGHGIRQRHLRSLPGTHPGPHRHITHDPRRHLHSKCRPRLEHRG